MERLSLEQLARLVDERPTSEERAILDADPGLRRELEALRAQKRSLRDLPAVLPPPDSWPELEEKLVAEGLVRGARRDPAFWRKWTRIAAGLVLFTGGTAFGWAAGGAPAAAPDGLAAGSDAAETEVASFASLEEAVLAVQEAEQEWTAAFAEFRRLLGAQSERELPADPAVKLAAIDALLAASRAAVEESPADQFFNGLVVSTLAERQQTLRQISQANWH
ncbi:MAG: hypothetical protein OXG38_01725 [Chloroflexi bacterium]|nr:hypothetical protein [Chloroflexota bacterium]MDE2805495.1 hypothetical protein [Gemmatimonadota bacterium]